MPLPDRFFKQVMRFALPGGEIANVGVHWACDQSPGPTNDIVNVTLNTRAASYWNALKLYTSPQLSYVGDLVYVLDNQGKTVFLYDNTIAPNPGTGTAATLPLEVATVVTTKAYGTSRRRRGRYYLPAPDTSRIGATGLYVLAYVNAMADAAKTYLTATVSEDIWSVIFSRADLELYPILTCSVGDVPDAQRRRRNGLQEARQSRTLEYHG